jgi:hypothetical protein
MNDAVVLGYSTTTDGTAAADGATNTLQLDSTAAPPKSRGIVQLTVTVASPGTVVATTSSGALGGGGRAEGVDVDEADGLHATQSSQVS